MAENVTEMSASEKKKEDWMNSKWRPMMGWMYMGVCIFDFVLAPVLWSLIQATFHGGVNVQWQPLTLQGAGLFHISMGAVLGLAAYGRTQEKLAGANNGGAVGTSYTPPAPIIGGFGNATTNVSSSGFTAPSVSASSGFANSSFSATPTTSTSFTPAPSWGTTPTASAPTVNTSGKKVIPTFDQPAL